MGEGDDYGCDDECEDCGDDLPVGINGAVWCYNCLLKRYNSFWEVKVASLRGSPPDTITVNGVEYVRVVPVPRSRGESSTADTGRCTDLESGL